MSARGMTLRLPVLRPRTRLYHLEPLGKGTPAVESLSGYVMRLAEAHSVTTSRLVAAEMLPLIRSQGAGTALVAPWDLDALARCNGTGELARVAVEALAALTGRPDLECLTLRPWAQMLAPYGLLRRHKQPRVWCDACYADALERGGPLYEPLSWSLAAVTVCPQHHVRLSARCPYDDCARALPLLAAAARPGYCSWCKRLLHRSQGGSPPGPDSVLDGGWDLWVAQQVGVLLALAPTLPTPTQATGASALDAFVRAHCGDKTGAYGLFARTVGIHANLLCAWRTGRSRPTLDLLLRVCYALGVSSEAFLVSDTNSLTVAVGPVALRASRRKPRQLPGTYDTERLWREVEALLADAPSPPPSVAEMARRLGCPSAVLARLFPAACRAIADRYRAYRAHVRDDRMHHLAADLKEVMTQYDAAGVYPSGRRVRARLQRRVHPRNRDYNRLRHQILQELGWNLGGTRIRRD
jgi:transcriptional regulator with XRE-family HTH domain